MDTQQIDALFDILIKDTGMENGQNESVIAFRRAEFQKKFSGEIPNEFWLPAGHARLDMKLLCTSYEGFRIYSQSRSAMGIALEENGNKSLKAAGFTTA